MLKGTCHCGAIWIQVAEPPESLIDCNCSICRRNGALWALYEKEAVQVSGHPEHTTEYIWGEKTIRTLRCSGCGCVTHWEPLQPEPRSKLGVNMRNFDPGAWATLRIRKFDGAETWSYLDDKK
jgi:hypothetical protein